MSNPDHETNAEKLTELLALKDQRIAELEAEVEKGFMLVRNRENKLRKRMAKVAELTNTGTVARQKDQLREQGQYIEALKAARVEEGEKIAELERENARIHELYSLDRAEHNSRGGA